VNRSSTFDLTICARCGKSYVAFLRRHLPAAAKLLKSPPRELSVALVGDAMMSRLHQQYLGRAGPTDVLSFELEHDAGGRCIAGEVIVCVPQARRQAAGEQRREVLLCALHGMLHLSGFDDRTGPQFTAMHWAEDRILRRLGVGPVFADSAAGRACFSTPSPSRRAEARPTRRPFRP
jgi:probable rRNA maturation factor